MTDPTAAEAAAAAPIRELAALLRRRRYRHDDEKGLQDGLALALEEAGVPARREHRLPGRAGIIDFLVGADGPGIGLEVKVGGGLAPLTRQLHRYAESPAVAGLLLVTTRSGLTLLPPTLRGKPLEVLLIRSAF